MLRTSNRAKHEDMLGAQWHVLSAIHRSQRALKIVCQVEKNECRVVIVREPLDDNENLDVDSGRFDISVPPPRSGLCGWPC